MLRQSFDAVLVGGGLQNALLALALRVFRPHARVAIVERDAELGGNHTWCFHSADVSGRALSFVEPLVALRWSGYSVHFARHSRTLDEPYACVTAATLASAVHAEAARRPGLSLFLGAAAESLEPGVVETSSGLVLEAPLIVDARGPSRFSASAAAGYQKFIGLELELEGDTAPTEPILMDARVPQSDGLRFLYVLPFAPNRLLLEDTYFSDSPDISRETLRQELLERARDAGHSVRRIVREEVGVLPLPRTTPARSEIDPRLLQGGYQGGWFHPTTGYSFPVAARFAEVVATAKDGELAASVTQLAREVAAQQRFATLLNRMLFDAFAPAERSAVFERFYRLPAATVRRFYALNLTRADRARILCGRPPAGFSLVRFLRATPRQHPAPIGVPP